jgi:GGDEF domain-containing protein
MRATTEAPTEDSQTLRQIDRLAAPIGYTLRREARDTDRIARVAPNRFHVLLPETSEGDALRYISRARQACEVWFTGASLSVRLRIEAASAGQDRSLVEALADVEDRLSA